MGSLYAYLSIGEIKMGLLIE